ncbi:LacI family DNA-binding transcriptional regulator [Catenuloplanes atrovinosus]|uniref:DNA-binding LacI/PurR family transcriptional regulator n=1 Tax=Catenuloplanes atrovinosus TaxID=137266 RepID=A0AAE4C7Q6_9ACTN|nr:LacI family DNA-binding transcriptional regulator [Catenuloplanes atrovinosus]MDR7274766.1 DNA-binding LacI/PurR family transcriptional regulator [Catenuloplanes atrovinosus]
MKPTLQTVADEVGVSRSTVSNAYGRPDQLSPELRERILDAARRLGYAGPNPTARSLRRGRAGAIGVLFTDVLSYAFKDPFAVRFLQGLSLAAERHSTGLLLIPIPDDADAARAAVRNAAVDGFCVFCVAEGHPARQAILERGLPVVGTELHATDPEMLAAGVDEVAATRTAGAHLTALGHHRVAIIADLLHPALGPLTTPVRGPEDVSYQGDRERMRGYQQAWEKAGLDWDEVTIINVAGNSREAGLDGAARALDRRDRPTALIAFSDVIALGALDALRARGLRAGRDVSVIGFDDIPQAAEAGLTTVRQPAKEKGRIAGELLLDPPATAEGRRVALPTELIVRASTGPALDGRN